METRTTLGNRTLSCTATCTAYENVLYENAMLIRKQLSRITNSESINTSTTIPSTGNAPKHMIVDHCFMAEHLESKPKTNTSKSSGSKRKKRRIQ